MKNSFLFLLAILFVILAGPLPVFANDMDADSYDMVIVDDEGDIQRILQIEYDGLVPCGRCLKAEVSNGAHPVFNVDLDRIHGCDSAAWGSGSETFVPCTLCHGFIVFDRVVSFFLGVLIPALALLFIVISGLIMITSTGNPDRIETAKKAFIASITGVFLAYASWAIVTLVISTFMEWDEVEWSVGGIEVQHMCNVVAEEIDFHTEDEENGEENGPENGNGNGPVNGNGPENGNGNGSENGNDYFELIINCEDGGNTTAGCGDMDVESGRTLNIEAVPEDEYEFAGWSDCDNVTERFCELEMSGDRSITAHFSEESATDPSYMCPSGEEQCDNWRSGAELVEAEVCEPPPLHEKYICCEYNDDTHREGCEAAYYSFNFQHTEYGDGSVLIQWSYGGNIECEGENFEIEENPGEIIVAPEEETTYAINCERPGGLENIREEITVSPVEEESKAEWVCMQEEEECENKEGFVEEDEEGEKCSADFDEFPFCDVAGGEMAKCCIKE